MGESLLKRVTEYLRDNVTVADLLNRLPLSGEKKPNIPPGNQTNYFVVCINPRHADSTQGGGSMHVWKDPGRASCFAEKLYNLSIFDLWSLHIGIDTKEQMEAGFSRSVREVAYLFSDRLDSAFGGATWKEAFGQREQESIFRRYFKTLTELDPYTGTLPPRTPYNDQPLHAWIVPVGQRDAIRKLMITAGKEAKRVDEHDGSIVVIWYEDLGVIGFHDEQLQLLAIGRPNKAKREADPIDFSTFVRSGDATSGKLIAGKDMPIRSIDPVRLFFVVESPLDYHMLWLLGQPAVLGRWSPEAGTVRRMRAGIDELRRLLDIPFLCLFALHMEGSDSADRFHRILNFKPTPNWVPRSFSIPFPSLGSLPPQQVQALIEDAMAHAVTPAFPG